MRGTMEYKAIVTHTFLAFSLRNKLLSSPSEFIVKQILFIVKTKSHTQGQTITRLEKHYLR